MKKSIIIILLIGVLGFFACDIFKVSIRNNPHDPRYDKVGDDRNKPGLPPVAPGDLRGVHSPSQNLIMLNWQDNSDYEEGYYLYRSPVLEDDFQRLTKIIIEADATSFIDDEIVPGSSYRYMLKGFNKKGEGSASNIAEVLVGAPIVKIDVLEHFTNENPVFNIIFSTDVEGFGNADDVKIENGTISSLEKFENTRFWLLTVKPAAEGIVGVTVLSGAALSPNSGLPNFQSIKAKCIYDITPPVVSLELNDVGGYWNRTEITGRVVFSDQYSVHEYYKMDSFRTQPPDDEGWILVSDSVNPLKLGENTSFNLNTNGQPLQTVKIMVKDLAGNTNEVEATTIMDTTSPVAANITQFDLYDTDTGYKGKTNDDTFSARIVASAAGGAPITKIYIHDTSSVDESNFQWITVGRYNSITEQWEAEDGWEYSDNGQIITGVVNGIPTIPDDYGNNYYIWIQDAVNNSPYDGNKEYRGAKRAAIEPDITAPGVQSITTNNTTAKTIFTIDFDDAMGTDFSEAEVYFDSLPTDVNFPTAGNPMNNKNCTFSLDPVDWTKVIIAIAGGAAPNTFEIGTYTFINIKGFKDDIGNTVDTSYFFAITIN